MRISSLASKNQYLQSIPYSNLLSKLQQHDRSTYFHSLRVGTYMDCFINTLQLFTHEQRQKLRTLGMFHDIGKLEVLTTILQKEGKLSKEEWKSIELHPVYGAMDMLKNAKDWSISDVEAILFHHENYDGTGYPNGIAGKRIPLVARMIRIVDTFDAITKQRSYKAAQSVDRALSVLKEGAGTLFDPDLVEEFIRGFIQKQERFMKSFELN